MFRVISLVINKLKLPIDNLPDHIQLEISSLEECCYENVFYVALKHGHLKCIKRMFDNGFATFGEGLLFLHGVKVDSDHVFRCLVSEGHIECLKYIRGLGLRYDFIYGPLSKNAIRHNQLECLKYIRGLNEMGESLREGFLLEAITNSNFEIIEYLTQAHCPRSTKSCAHAASLGKLSILKYLHENNFPWSHATCTNALRNMHMPCLIYAYKNGCEYNKNDLSSIAMGDLDTFKNLIGRKIIDINFLSISNTASLISLDVLKYVCTLTNKYNDFMAINAAEKANLEVIEYLHSINSLPQNISLYAAKGGSLPILKFLYQNKYPFDISTCALSAKHKHLECLKFLHEECNCPWDQTTTFNAYSSNCNPCYEYAITHGCPVSSVYGVNSLYRDRKDPY
jgi:hypothetical protein